MKIVGIHFEVTAKIAVTRRPRQGDQPNLETVKTHEAQVQQEALEEYRRIAALPPEQQYAAMKSTLNLLLLRALGEELFAVLEDECRTGRYSSVQVFREAAAATRSRLHRAQYLDGLRSELTLGRREA